MLEFYLALINEQGGNESDRDKLVYIYNTYYHLMLAVAVEYLKDKSSAEDVVHDSIMKLIPHLHKIDIFEDTLAAKGYILTTVKNKAKDYNKSTHFMEETSVEIDSEDFDIPSDVDMLEALMSDEGYRYLKQCIHALNDTYRDTLILKLICNKTEKEISEILDISESAVGVRIMRGKNILKRMLKEYRSSGDD